MSRNAKRVAYGALLVFSAAMMWTDPPPTWLIWLFGAFVGIEGYRENRTK